MNASHTLRGMGIAVLEAFNVGVGISTMLNPRGTVRPRLGTKIKHAIS
jgi:hypothetical protein